VDHIQNQACFVSDDTGLWKGTLSPAASCVLGGASKRSACNET
jgi:hypothetical protein